jgi:NAD(P)-dependent dehydrogenase (short-subunit alcohol dehydrogenase family)
VGGLRDKETVMNAPPTKDLLDFKGKVVVVTGAGRGLGAGIAARFAEAGAAVVVNYRASEAAAKEVVKAIHAAGGRAMAVGADVSDAAAVERLFEETAKTFGPLDALVNNAGIYPVSSLLEMKDEEWEQVVDANLRSVHLCTQAAARRWVAQGRGGAIVNIASINASQPAAGQSHYNAAKAAVVMHTRSSAQELGRHGIRVNVVSPGVIWQEGIEEAWPEGVARYLKAVPLARLGLADDIADACLFLASPAARWITGANLAVDGGILACNVY